MRFANLFSPNKEAKEELYSAAHERLVDEGNKGTFKKLINEGELVVGVHEESVFRHADVVDQLNNLVTSGNIWYFANNRRKFARRSPIACGPNSRPAERNLKILKNQAPTLYSLVNHVAGAYAETGKTLAGVWWTYYRKETGVSETVWIPLGKMKPHGDVFAGGVTDRVVATLGSNPNGGQKRMSFEYKGVKDSKVWMKVHHGMFVCLSAKSSGFRKFGKKTVIHGVDGAEGTWTLTLEFIRST